MSKYVYRGSNVVLVDSCPHNRPFSWCFIKLYCLSLVSSAGELEMAVSRELYRSFEHRGDFVITLLSAAVAADNDLTTQKTAVQLILSLPGKESSFVCRISCFRN